jgi:hypothetical protein
MLLYANFDIAYDFVFLHHTVMCILPFWASRTKILHSPETNLCSLWRWVLGTAVDSDAVMSEYVEFGVEGHTLIDGTVSYRYTGEYDTVYWRIGREWNVFLNEKLVQFFRTWIKPLGCVLSGQDCPGCDAALFQSLRSFVTYRCNEVFYLQLQKTMSSTESNRSLVEACKNTRSLDNITSAFTDVFQQDSRQVLWENFYLVTLPRKRVFCDVFPGAYGAAVTRLLG